MRNFALSANTIKVCWIDLELNRLSDFNVNLVNPAINGINIIYIRLHIRNFIEFTGALLLDLKKKRCNTVKPRLRKVENSSLVSASNPKLMICLTKKFFSIILKPF